MISNKKTGGIPVAFVKPYPPFTRAAARVFDQLLVHLVKAKLPKAPHLSPGATAHTRGDIEGVNRWLTFLSGLSEAAVYSGVMDVEHLVLPIIALRPETSSAGCRTPCLVLGFLKRFHAQFKVHVCIRTWQEFPCI